jgi:STIP1 family protein 1
VGDEAYDKKDFIKAIEHYSKAIQLSEGSESTFFRNRGEAYKQIKELDLALKDAI